MIVAFSVSTNMPNTDGSVHEAVAAAVQVVRDSGLPNNTSSMFTSIVDLGHGSFIRPAGI
ncbi:thiamine-binding protein [Arthrobacter rhombi]